MNKFILAKNSEGRIVLRYANVDLHYRLVYEKSDKAIYGGGMFDFSEDGMTMLLYGRSTDYGVPRFDEIKDKIHIDEDLAGCTIKLSTGYDDNFKPIEKDITNRFIFDEWC